MPQSPHISVRGLTKVFSAGDRALTALDAVDMDVDRGAFVSIIGPSGGGKTTLLKAIGGLLEPTSGTVLIDGLPPSSAQRAKDLGFVFQDSALLPWRTVIQNLRLPLELNGGRANGLPGEPERIMEAVGLAEFAEYYPHELSGGMRQRVALARALVLDPAVLLMDEPMGALDEITRVAMRYELVQLWERSPKTVVFVTHSIPEAVILSDRIVVMSGRPGRVIRDITVELPRPRDEAIEHSPDFIDYTREIKLTLRSGAAGGAATAEARA